MNNPLPHTPYPPNVRGDLPNAPGWRDGITTKTQLCFILVLAKYPVFARESHDILWKAALLATSTFQCNGLISLQFALSRKNSKISVFRCRGSKWVPIEVNFEVVSRHNPWDFSDFFFARDHLPPTPDPPNVRGDLPSAPGWRDALTKKTQLCFILV